jgi:hypothetical protein
MKHGQKEVVRVSFNYKPYDRLWAWGKIQTIPSESEAIRKVWDKLYDSLPPIDKEMIDKYLEKHPSPRMEREQKSKCE